MEIWINKDREMYKMIKEHNFKNYSVENHSTYTEILFCDNQLHITCYKNDFEKKNLFLYFSNGFFVIPVVLFQIWILWLQ